MRMPWGIAHQDGRHDRATTCERVRTMKDADPVVVEYDPRVVAEYDDLNPDGPDHDYFRTVANGLDEWLASNS